MVGSVAEANEGVCAEQMCGERERFIPLGSEEVSEGSEEAS